MPPLRPLQPSDLAPPAPDDGQLVPGSHVVRVPEGELAVVARDGVTLASEADSLVLSAATQIVLTVGRSTLTLRADGTILLNGRRMTLSAPEMIDLNPDDPAQAPDPPGDGGPGGDDRPCGCADRVRRRPSGDAP